MLFTNKQSGKIFSQTWKCDIFIQFPLLWSLWRRLATIRINMGNSYQIFFFCLPLVNSFPLRRCLFSQPPALPLLHLPPISLLCCLMFFIALAYCHCWCHHSLCSRASPVEWGPIGTLMPSLFLSCFSWCCRVIWHDFGAHRCPPTRGPLFSLFDPYY